MPAADRSAARADDWRRPAVIVAVLVALVWIVFGQTTGHDFVNFDDEVYVYQNPKVSGGLSLDAIEWAFTHAHARNWHPLTTLTHMLDCQLFGLAAGGHHAVNVAIHSANGALLFLLLRGLTGSTWRSAAVAALFAVHPLRVESVAWIAERKDVLSGLFFLHTLMSYARYVRRGSQRKDLALCAAFYGLGLMAKPMLVTVPFVLLILDFWPLGRMAESRSRVSWPSLLREKAPFFVLATLSAIATLLAQHSAAGRIAPMPIGWRLSNALSTAATYVLQIFWPVDLAPFYPHAAGTFSAFGVAAAAIFLLALAALAWRLRGRTPWLLAGWIWYCVMLLPVIGLIQIGTQARADRYTYLPHIGLYFAIIWSAWHLSKASIVARTATSGAYAVSLAALGMLSWKQTQHWRDSRSLWTHALAVTRDNEVAENNLGLLCARDGDLDAAIAHYRRAVAIQETRGATRYDLTTALAENNIGNAEARKGDPDTAVAHYQRATALRPDYADGFYNLGTTLLQRRDAREAAAAFSKAIELRPDDAAAHGRLGDALRQLRDNPGALREYERAYELAPHEPWAQYSLAWMLATADDASIRNTRRAAQIAGGSENAAMLRVLAAVKADERNFPEATAVARRGLEAAMRAGDAATFAALQRDIAMYEAGVPVREIIPVQ